MNIRNKNLDKLEKEYLRIAEEITCADLENGEETNVPSICILGTKLRKL
jgi:hypothetical protein